MELELSNLTKEEAEKFLANFLNKAKNGFETQIPELNNLGIIADYTLSSIKPYIIWVVGKLNKTPKAIDNSLPSWVTETESYKNGLYSFDDESQILLLRASYYLGETFIRSSEKLKWGIGDENYVYKNRPVVKGFEKNMELDCYNVVNNICRRIIQKTTTEDIDIMIEYWSKVYNKK